MIVNPLAELHVPSGDDWVCAVTPRDRKRKPFRIGISAKAGEQEAIHVVTDLLNRRGIGPCDLVLKRKWQWIKGRIETPRTFLERYL
jgi:hypothetical protein